jgi:hypothetical protein
MPRRVPSAQPGGDAPKPKDEAPKPKKGKKPQGSSSDSGKIRTYQDEDGCWHARVSREQILACPATWMMAVATVIGVLMLLLHFIGLPLGKGFVVAMLGVGGVAWLAGFVTLQEHYYKKWSDFAEQKLTKAEAPEPGWMKIMEFVPLGAVMLSGICIMQAAEDAELKATACEIGQSMSQDKAAVKAAVEEFHNDCWTAAQEGFGKRKRTNRQTYLDAMRARLQTRFARRGSLPLRAVAARSRTAMEGGFWPTLPRSRLARAELAVARSEAVTRQGAVLVALPAKTVDTVLASENACRTADRRQP